MQRWYQAAPLCFRVVPILRVGLSGEDTFTNTSPTTISVGGIKEGTTFDNMPVTEVLNKLLYPHIDCSISALAVNYSPGGVQEKGTNVTILSCTAYVGKGSANIKSLTFYDPAQPDNKFIYEDVEALNRVGSSQITWDFNDYSIMGGSSATYQVDVLDSDGVTVSKTGVATPTWVYPYYYGVVEADITASKITEAQIEAMTKLIQAKGTKNLTFTTTNQKAVIAYPASYGAIKKILDPNSFDVTNSFETSTVSITGKDNTAVTYNVYVSYKAATTSNFKYTISY